MDTAKRVMGSVGSCQMTHVVAARRGTFYVLYEVREDLGEGAFGKVVRVRRRRDGRMFVAKIMHDRGMSEKARQEVCLRVLACTMFPRCSSFHGLEYNLLVWCRTGSRS